ncbi:DUF6448 family protein [Salegentibacter flavus]|uniref:Uncharacterized protein n=1 Tax=Salegentibacter flavus TaxID=287099 RepID=A0A1I5D4L0_9FLAO|nr:DUF6448 family protein [Salegentibacter flavus]SFN94077.1 hypothetical protein SAMN05660413_03165 [Salegentibacter flavus]
MKTKEINLRTGSPKRLLSRKRNLKTTFSIVIGSLLILFAALPASAHCDRENGPVAKDAMEALKTGDFNKISIWVGQEQEEELEAKFKQTLAVYNDGDAARQLATDYFMETAVRLHREAEGMPFTGLKPASPNPPDIAKAEKALETGDIRPLQILLMEEMEKETSRWFQKALETKKNKEKSVEAGRQWVDSYVKYIVFTHKLYQQIQAGPPHGVGE